jgi:hypothetical protein
MPMPLSVDKALSKAQIHTKAGELVEAEELYKQVLSKFPKNKKAIQGYQKLKAGVTSKASSNSKPPREQVQELTNLYNQRQWAVAVDHAQTLTACSIVSWFLFSQVTFCCLFSKIKCRPLGTDPSHYGSSKA